MNLIQYITMSIITSKFCKNMQILLKRDNILKSTISNQKCQILSGLNWSFSTFCIYFLLYRDLNGCEWTTWPYKIGYLLPICVMLFVLSLGRWLEWKYEIKIGTVTHGFDVATNAFHCYQIGICLVFIGAFVWILLQSTCSPNSGLEYIPAHSAWHVLFGYGYIRIAQYYIYLVNDLEGNRMMVVDKMSTLFPYFTKYKGVYIEESQRMLSQSAQISEEQIFDDNDAGATSTKAE